MLYNAAGFARSLGHAVDEIARPSWMHFGIGLPDRAAVRAARDRLVADGIELVEECDEPGYFSVKCRDPDGYIVDLSWGAGTVSRVWTERRIGYAGVLTRSRSRSAR